MQQRDSGATRAPSFGTALRSYRDFGTALAEENGQNGFFQVCPTFLRPTHWSQGGWQSLLAQRHQLGRAEQRARLARRLAVEQRLHHQLERFRVAVVVEVLDILVAQ